MPPNRSLTLVILSCALCGCGNSGSGASSVSNSGAQIPAVGGSTTSSAGSAASAGAGVKSAASGSAGNLAAVGGNLSTGGAGAGAGGGVAGSNGVSGSSAAIGGGAAAGSGGAAAGSGGAAAGSSGQAAPPPSGSFAPCVAALKPMCRYDDKEMSCSSLMTASIPLSNGMSWGNVEIKGGPYGAYVAFNQGKAFANPVNDSESSCDLIASTFGEPASVTADALDLRGGDLSLYTVFRPACMKDGEKYPVITWGNGTCGQSGGYASLLATVASYGFVVFAANSRFTDAGNNEMLKALDFAKAANEDASSPLYQHLDLDHIGAAGHSQGSSATAHAASDARIKAVILFNAGTSAVKPFLAVSGDNDITGYTPAQMASEVGAAAQPGAWLYYHKILQTGGSVTGHLTLMEQPERVTGPTTAWFQWQLKGDEEAKKVFVGDSCGLCAMKDDHEVGANAQLK